MSAQGANAEAAAGEAPNNNLNVAAAGNGGAEATMEQMTDDFHQVYWEENRAIDEVRDQHPFCLVEALRDIQAEHEALEAQYYRERAALDVKYERLYAPLYEARKQIVNGEPVALDRFKYAEMREAYGRGIKGFWAISMRENELLHDFITDRDAEVLEYLKDVKCIRTEFPGGFRLEFWFRENPHFRNEVLCKHFFMADENETVIEAGGGSVIEWYEGRQLGAQPTRFASFFNFFEHPAAPSRSNDQAREKAGHDLQIGIVMKDEIIPHAVSWLTGDAVPPVQDEEAEEMDDGGEATGPGEIDDDRSEEITEMEAEDSRDVVAEDVGNP